MINVDGSINLVTQILQVSIVFVHKVRRFLQFPHEHRGQQHQAGHPNSAGLYSLCTQSPQ